MGKHGAGEAYCVRSQQAKAHFVEHNIMFGRTLLRLVPKTRESEVVFEAAKKPPFSQSQIVARNSERADLPNSNLKVELPITTLAAMKNEHGVVTVQEYGLVSLDLSREFSGTA